MGDILTTVLMDLIGADGGDVLSLKCRSITQVGRAAGTDVAIRVARETSLAVRASLEAGLTSAIPPAAQQRFGPSQVSASLVASAEYLVTGDEKGGSPAITAMSTVIEEYRRCGMEGGLVSASGRITTLSRLIKRMQYEPLGERLVMSGDVVLSPSFTAFVVTPGHTGAGQAEPVLVSEFLVLIMSPDIGQVLLETIPPDPGIEFRYLLPRWFIGSGSDGGAADNGAASPYGSLVGRAMRRFLHHRRIRIDDDRSLYPPDMEILTAIKLAAREQRPASLPYLNPGLVYMDRDRFIIAHHAAGLVSFWTGVRGRKVTRLRPLVRAVEKQAPPVAFELPVTDDSVFSRLVQAIHSTDRWLLGVITGS